MAKSIACSVPAHDHRRVGILPPGTKWYAESVSQITPDRECRVLALTIHDRLDPAGWDNLGAVVTRSDGYDHLPLEDLAAREIACYHLGDYATHAVAEHTVGLMLALLRRTIAAHESTSSGSWARDALVGRSLRDVTVGVLGTGRIGSQVCRYLQAMGASVLAHDLQQNPELTVEYTSIENLLAASDVLTIHVPLDSSTAGLLDARRLATLPPGACVVNTARGEVIDQTAIMRLLESGHLTGYAADVLPAEPQPDLGFWHGVANVLLTPHLGAHTHDTIDRRYQATGAIMEAVLAGRPEAVSHLRVA